MKNTKEYLHSRATSSSWFTASTLGSLWRKENFWMNNEPKKLSSSFVNIRFNAWIIYDATLERNDSD